MINDASIYSTIVVVLAFIPMLFFVILKGQKRLPEPLLRGKFLLCWLLMIGSFVSLSILVLFFSNEYGVIAKFFGWILFSHTCLGLILVLWILFFMHGYDIRYLFKKVIVPAPMCVLYNLVIWLTVSLSFNYWAMIPSFIFTVCSLFWNIKAFKLTKPFIDEDVPLRENDDGSDY